jgi:hypothetical protein
VKAAYLIDPVDNTTYTPESTDYPSAVRALRELGKAVAITGAGIVGRCNPNGSNSEVKTLKLRRTNIFFKVLFSVRNSHVASYGCIMELMSVSVCRISMVQQHQSLG